MATTSNAANNNKNKSLEEVLDDLCSRFIINLPNEELESFDRLCFQIEAAHWFYLDFFREEMPKLPVFNLKEFVRQSILYFLAPITHSALICIPIHSYFMQYINPLFFL